MVLLKKVSMCQVPAGTKTVSASFTEGSKSKLSSEGHI